MFFFVDLLVSVLFLYRALIVSFLFEMAHNEDGNDMLDSLENGDEGLGENGDDGHGMGDPADDQELEAIKARVKEMEEEAEKLKQMQCEVDKQMNLGSPTGTNAVSLSYEEKVEADSRSIYVGNVDYGATAEELEAHFHGCGAINRVTILTNKYDGHPKGFAYIEFSEKDSVKLATAMDDSLFRGRQIKVLSKRTNRPGLSTTNRYPYRGVRGRGGTTRGFIRGYMYPTYRPTRRGRGTFRRGFITPY